MNKIDSINRKKIQYEETKVKDVLPSRSKKKAKENLTKVIRVTSEQKRILQELKLKRDLTFDYEAMDYLLDIYLNNTNKE